MTINVSRKFDVNSRILQLVEYFGISRNKFAAEIGISSSRMSNITTNRNRPDSEMLSRIAKKYTNVNMTWVLTGNGGMLIDSSERLNEPESVYNKDCAGCKEKQKQLDHLQNTVEKLLEESKKDHELIRELILRKDDPVNKL